jgi:hypothetical protein
MRVEKLSDFTGKLNVMELDVTDAQIDEFIQGGRLIQHIFPNLSEEEREFLKTGITPEEWAEGMTPPSKKKGRNMTTKRNAPKEFVPTAAQIEQFVREFNVVDAAGNKTKNYDDLMLIWRTHGTFICLHHGYGTNVRNWMRICDLFADAATDPHSLDSNWRVMVLAVMAHVSKEDMSAIKGIDKVN